MNTIQKLIAEKKGLPESTAWYLNDLAEAKGRQQMFMSQSPQRLKAPREHALIESAAKRCLVLIYSRNHCHLMKSA